MDILRAAWLAAATCGSMVAAGASDRPDAGRWTFRALLDGKPIGEHRFVVTPEAAGGVKVESVARFDVKVLMVTAYRYRHAATEHWRGDCLEALSARTDDDGRASRVEAERAGDSLEVDSPAGTQKLEGCVMSFAYWNPDIRGQSALLNAQTGRYESVRIEALPPADIEVHGRLAAAIPYRISGPAQPVTVWYSPQGDWLGLDAKVAGGRTLSYRLE